MGEILILTSINGCILTNELIDSWLNTNEMFIINKNFSKNQYSVEITFIDEERADMISDLLTTCYSDYISISRPQTLITSYNNSDDERVERESSPIHLSSSLSTSSRVTCFSQRLTQLDKKQNDKNIELTIGRGRINQINLSHIDISSAKEINDDKEDSIINSHTISPVPSIDDSTFSSVLGRGRGTIFK